MMAAADLRVDDSLVEAVDWVSWHGPRPVGRVAVLGFSRGAQSAHRFAMRHPDRITALVALSAGTYTMPTSTAAYPFGMGAFSSNNHGKEFDAICFARLHAFVGVGRDDDVDGDVVREWDAVGGTNRLERAMRFADALRTMRLDVEFQIFPGVGHAMSSDMVADSTHWLADVFSTSSAPRCKQVSAEPIEE
jgi:pimeloyl-ACP methyl ester carboxylesterase